MGNYEEAKKYMYDLLNIVEQKVGEVHPEIVAILGK